MRFESFQQAVQVAVKEGLPLHLTGSDSITLTDTIHISDNDCELIVIGCLSTSASDKSVIESYGHSMFQISGRRSKIRLENLILRHQREDVDKKNVGAVVFASNNSTCTIIGSELSSASGFSLWAVQHAQCHVSSSRFTSTKRSGCVAFGHAKLLIDRSVIYDCFQHGICLRGSCSLHLRHSTVTSSGFRAVYGYEYAQIHLQDCYIEKTKSFMHAAVEILGFSSSAGETYSVSSVDASKYRRRSPAPAPALIAKNVMFKSNNGAEIATLGQNVNSILENNMLYCATEDCYNYISTSDVVTERLVSKSTDVEKSVEKMGWAYHLDDEKWQPYSEKMSDWISEKYEQWLQRFTASHNTLIETDNSAECPACTAIQMPHPLQMYEIDFSRLVQVNAETQFSRKVRKLSTMYL